MELRRVEHGAARSRPNLEQTLFQRTVEPNLSPAVTSILRTDRDEVRSLGERVQRLEHELRALKRWDAASGYVDLTHTRLLCESTGYSIIEVDEPPPAVGAAVLVDGRRFDVSRVGPSPFPGDARRCAILAPAHPNGDAGSATPPGVEVGLGAVG